MVTESLIEEVTDPVVHHEHKTAKTPKVLHNEKEVTDQGVADVDAAEEDDAMVTESLIENLVIQRAHTRDLINVKVLVLETGVLLKMICWLKLNQLKKNQPKEPLPKKK